MSKSLRSFLLLALVTTTIVIIVIPQVIPQLSRLFQPFEIAILNLENQYQIWFEQQHSSNPQVVIPLAFIGGLIASISPCILGLLPINLSYIGTLELTSRRDAFFKAGWFVLGVVTVLSIVGLFAGLAASIFVDYRGYVNILVGIIILLMSASFTGIWHIPLPRHQIELPIPGSYGVGVTFALVSSPCASPVLFAVLSAAAASGSQLVSVLAMVSYAIGYTFIIFFASLFTGLIKQSRRILNKSDRVMSLGSLVLFVAGAYYVINGILWFFP